MSDKKYVVPEGMKRAAIDAQAASAMYTQDRTKDILTLVLEAALRWQAENPRIPTHEQAIHLCEIFEDESGSRRPDYCDSVRAVAIEWQRRMYLAPEPEVPEGKIADLMWGILGSSSAGQHDPQIREAYRRGYKAGVRITG